MPRAHSDQHADEPAPVSPSESRSEPQREAQGEPQHETKPSRLSGEFILAQLSGERSEFSRRLANFGLSETQPPLLAADDASASSGPTT